MKKLLMAMTMVMALSLSVGAFAFDRGYGGLEGNDLAIEQHGAFNAAGVVQDVDSYGNRVFNKADIYQSGLLNFINVDQKATWHSNRFKTKQVGFGNSYCVYQR